MAVSCGVRDAPQGPSRQCLRGAAAEVLPRGVPLREASRAALSKQCLPEAAAEVLPRGGPLRQASRACCGALAEARVLSCARLLHAAACAWTVTHVSVAVSVFSAGLARRCRNGGFSP